MPTQPDTLDAARIAERIPHGAGMSLLEAVEHWDENAITCSTGRHRDADMPLRENGELYTVALAEFAAQAAAVHASLMDTGMGAGGPAFLGAVRSLELHTELVPDSDAPLRIEARAELKNAGGAVYGFDAYSGEQLLVRGQLVLVQPNRP